MCAFVWFTISYLQCPVRPLLNFNEHFLIVMIDRDTDRNKNRCSSPIERFFGNKSKTNHRIFMPWCSLVEGGEELAQQQCNQIGRFVVLWSTIESLWQQLICPNLSHSWASFVKVSKSFVFLVNSLLGNFYRHLAIFFWSH